MKNMKKAIAIVSAFSLPMLALAQTVQTILLTVKVIIDYLTVLVVALALLAFLWGLMKYIFSGPGEGKDSGRDLMIWGIIGLFVMVSVWGLVRVLSNTFGVGAGGSAPIPGVGNIIPGTSGSTGSVTVGVTGTNGSIWGSLPIGN